LIGLWEGLIKVDEGTEDEPHVLRIAGTGYANTDHPLIKLKRNGAFSGWSSLVWAFEQLLIKNGDGSAGFEKEITSNMLQFTPERLSGAVAEVPSVIESLLNFRARAMATSVDQISGKIQVSAAGIEEQKQVLEFWTNDFLKAWKLSDSGVYLESLNSYRSLD